MIELTQEEEDFILQLFSKVQIGVADSNAVEVCNLVRSITKKFKDVVK